MERRFKVLLAGFALLLVGCLFASAVPLVGLSMIMGISVLGSSVLGSSVLGSSVLGSSVLGTTTTVMAAYNEAIAASQVWVSLAAIGMLVYVVLSDPAYGKSRRVFSELRQSWIPVSTLFIVLFGIVVALKVWAILA